MAGQARRGRPAGSRKTDEAAGDEREARNGQVQSLARALAILNALAENPAGMTLTGIAHRVGLAPSTAHRLLTTLQNDRFVRFDRDRGTWKVGVQAFVVGNVFLESRDLVLTARPYMEGLVEQSGETVNLAVAERGEVVYLSQVECQEMMRALAKPGARVPMHCSAVGKALLAELDEAEIAKIIKLHGLPQLTERSITSPAGLQTALRGVRRAGYAIDDEEHALGLRCVAAAVFDEYGKPIAAVSVSGPKIRIMEGRLAGLGGMVAEAARGITAALGGVAPRRPDGKGREAVA